MMEEAHRMLAGVVGELSLSIVRGSGSRAKMRLWAQRLRHVAEKFEEKAR